MAFDTFDTDSVATAGITFSNGNLTALGFSGLSIGNSAVAQAREGKKSGKWYVEFTFNAASGNIDGVGLCPAWGIASTSGNCFVGGNPFSAPNSGDGGWGYYSNGNVANKNSTQSSVNNTSYAAADVIGVAIDLDNAKVWFRKNTGSWIGTTGSPDPATNTNGFDISDILTHNCRVFPAANMSGSAAQWTANFGATAFTGAVPSGFTSGWTNTTLGTYFGTFATTGKSGTTPASPGASKTAVAKYVASVSGQLTDVIFPFAGTTVIDLVACIYAADGTAGAPGTLLGKSTNTIASGTFGEQDFTFSGVTIVNGTTYWIGLISDASTNSTVNNLLCPPGTAFITSATDTYPNPSNPFAGSPSTINSRFPLIALVTPATTVSVTGVTSTGTAHAVLGAGSPGLTQASAVCVAGSAVPQHAGSGSTLQASAGGQAHTLFPELDALLLGVSSVAVAGDIPHAEGSISGVSSLAYANPVGFYATPISHLPLNRLMRNTPVPAMGVLDNTAVAVVARLYPSGPQPVSREFFLTGVASEPVALGVNPVNNPSGVLMQAFAVPRAGSVVGSDHPEGVASHVEAVCAAGTVTVSIV